MRTLRVFASLLAFPCPFNEVGFPSVSPFWAVFNLAPFNNLRSDYPLDLRSVEWLILDRIRDTDMVGCLLADIGIKVPRQNTQEASNKASGSVLVKEFLAFPMAVLEPTKPPPNLPFVAACET